MSLGNPLRAEGHLDLQVALVDIVLDLAAGPRVDGAAQYEGLACTHVFQTRLEHLEQDVDLWVQVAVDRRADDQNDVARVGQDPRIAGERERSLAKHLAEPGLETLVEKRRLAGTHRRDRLLVDVIDERRAAGRRVDDRQRQPDVTASADDGNGFPVHRDGS